MQQIFSLKSSKSFRSYNMISILLIFLKKIECVYRWNQIEKTRWSTKSKFIFWTLRTKGLWTRFLTSYMQQTRCFELLNRHFFYSIFCVWKSNAESEQKNRSIINIKKLNVIIQSNAYSLSLQNKIIVVIRNCLYIFVIDCFVFFYQ